MRSCASARSHRDIFFEFDEVDTFTAGAIGEPGSRTFYLHARRGPAAGHREVREAAGDGDRPVPAPGAVRPAAAGGPPAAGVDRAARPGEQAFVLGPIGLGYDRGNDRLLVQLEELVADLGGRRRGRAPGRRRAETTAGTSGST